MHQYLVSGRGSLATGGLSAPNGHWTRAARLRRARLGAAGAGASRALFEVRDRGLHHLGRLQHERQLHLPAAEQVADDLHAVEQDPVDDVERRIAFAGRVEVGDERSRGGPG